MKANELMLGDYVRFKHGIDKVVGVSWVPGLGDCAWFAASATLFPERVEDVNPIPLTPETLEKNGFVLSKKSSRKPYQLRDNSNYVSVIKGRLNARYYEKFGKPINAMQIDCNYVHELQHALRLCGIDKEINV